jgi:hypothetical protein
LHPADFNRQSLRDKQPSSRKRDEHLSANGKWRSLPKVPPLLQYVISGNCFGKVKSNGKTIRHSLQTTVCTTAQLKLNDFLKEHRENRNKFDPPKFSEALEIYERELDADANMKPRSKGYRRGCILKLQRTRPELWKLPLDEIKPQACKDWAAQLQKEIASQYFNNMIGTLRLVIDRGIKAHKAKSGIKLENPASELRRVVNDNYCLENFNCRQPGGFDSQSGGKRRYFIIGNTADLRFNFCEGVRS